VDKGFYLIAYWQGERMHQSVYFGTPYSWVMEKRKWDDGPYVLVGAIPITPKQARKLEEKL